LPRNATALQKAKYQLCRKLLACQMENKLTNQDMIAALIMKTENSRTKNKEFSRI
jgi:hypothetical protein